jgi:hypothetical protein
MKHSRKCCKVSLSQVDKDGVMRPKSFHELRISCSQIPDQDFKTYVNQCAILPLLGYRIRLRLHEFMLRTIVRQTSIYLEKLKLRQ